MGNSLPSRRRASSSTTRPKSRRSPTLPDARQGGRVCGRVALGHDQRHRPADRLLLRVAEHALRALVPGPDRALQVSSDDGIGGGVGDGTQARLALLEGAPGLAFGLHVAPAAGTADDDAGLVEDGPQRDRDPAVVAGGRAHAHLVACRRAAEHIALTGAQARHVVRVHELGERSPDEVLGPPADERRD